MVVTSGWAQDRLCAAPGNGFAVKYWPCRLRSAMRVHFGGDARDAAEVDLGALTELVGHEGNYSHEQLGSGDVERSFRLDEPRSSCLRWSEGDGEV